MISNIKKIGLVVLATVLGVLSINAQTASTWSIDKTHSSVNFSIGHLLSSVTGKFKNFDGNIKFDPNNLQSSAAEFTIFVKSIDTDASKRDEHLQNEDFFNSEKYPTITFKSTKIEKKSGMKYLVHGKLTIKDVTKNVVLPLTITGEMDHPMMKNTVVLGLVVDTEINRTDYGVGTGSWAASAVVSNKVKIHIPMELTRKK